jgi:transposase InsO family protein
MGRNRVTSACEPQCLGIVTSTLRREGTAPASRVSQSVRVFDALHRHAHPQRANTETVGAAA